jgi:hypothetical protein
MIMADLLVGTGRQPTHSRRSQQTDALMVLARSATFETSELLARCEQWLRYLIDGSANFVPLSTTRPL